MTLKLYYDNPYMQEFTAEVVETGTDSSGTPYVVLDQTTFYPTGGGQPCDLGTIGNIDVIDVEEVDGKLLHRLSEPFPADADRNVYGRIDWQRRFDHMQQHTGQHLLSAAFEQLFDGETFGFHLGRDMVTVDIMLPELTQEMVDHVEQLANTIVFENRDVYATWFESEEELMMIPLRKPPKVTENIRIVTVDDFDYSACGGTHPYRTGEVGPIKVLAWSKHKGGNRVEFVCGWRTLKAMTEKQLVLRQLSRQLTSGEAELPSHIDRMLGEKKETDRALEEANGKLLQAQAGELLSTAESVHGLQLISQTFDNLTMQQLQKLAQHLTSQDPAAIALLVSTGEKMQLVFARGSDVGVPMNDLLKVTLPLIEGKGGGSPAIAQGGGTANVDPQELLLNVRSALMAKLA